MLQLSQLFIYPVKSLGGIPKQAVEITATGFKHDRRWMLVDEHHQFLSQRSHPQMVLLHLAETADGFMVSKFHEESMSIHIPSTCLSKKLISVTVWDDVCNAIEVSDLHNEWFSDMLNVKCKLVYMPDDTKRLVDQQYAKNEEITSFSDGYPMLMIGEASLELLNSKLADTLPMSRFRPNLVFTGGHAHIEDEMAAFEINGLRFLGVKPCARCVMTTINEKNAEAGKEPLKTLATYRMKNNKIYFGQNVLQQQTGTIKTGDEIKIITQLERFI